MRDGPDLGVLAGAFRWSPIVSAWKGTTLLAARVPVASGRLSANASQEVPERLTFTVPDRAPETGGGPHRSWVPEDPDHPLGQYGQWVQVDIRVRSSVRPVEWITRLGRFQIQDWDHDDIAREVRVECVGMLQRPLDARFRVPESPRVDGTFASEFRRLMVPGVPVEIDPALSDRPVPQSFQWQEDRLSALYEIADAWPARLRMDDAGTVRVLPPLPDQPDPVLILTEGERGTVIGAPRRASRDGVYNVVVARSSRTDDPSSAPLQAVRVVQYGPLAPERYGEVVKFWSSPLASTVEQLDASAATMLANSVRPAIRQRVTTVPDPRIELDDAVQLVRGVTAKTTVRRTENATVTRGWVVGYDLPLTVEDGPMTITVGVA